MADMNDERFTSIVSQLVKDARQYREQLGTERTRSMEYYDGKMRDTPAESTRSQVVSRDVRAQVKKVLPSLTRTILGNDKVCEFAPMGEGDDQSAEQATDYINNVVFPESNGYDAVSDAVFDALTVRNGYLRWWRDKRVETTISEHTGLDEAALTQLVADDSVTVLSQKTYRAAVEGDQGPQLETFYDVKIRHRTTTGRNRLAAVPPENMLISPQALDLDESPIVGIVERMRRSDLVAMGFDKKIVMNAPESGASTDREDENQTRRRDIFNKDSDIDKALQEVDYYDLYVRIDKDDDGIAELWRCQFVGQVNEEGLLDAEETDEVPFQDIIVERRPHQREGTSVSDDTMEIQRIKTALLRQTLDNIYWQNALQPIVQEGAIQNPESVLNPSFGMPIRVAQGMDVRSAVGYNQVPLVAQTSFDMLAYFDAEATDRTGISDVSGGLAPDALTNVTAKASSMIEAAGIAQTEQMVRTVAERLKKVFKGLLKLTIKHQDKPRVVRLRKQWVTFDPRQWNAGMDVDVNTGLGAGTRERDMMMMQVVGQQQEKLLAAYGPTNNPFVTAENIWNSVSKGVEATGLRTPELYFTQPTEESMKAFQDAQANQPNPQMEKLKVDQAKAQSDAQLAMQKLQQENQLEVQRMQMEFQLKRYQIDKELELKRQQSLAQALTRETITPVRVGGDAG